MYPIDQIRQQFLGLNQPDQKGQLPLLLDGPGGSQLPKSVVDSMANYLYHFNSNMGGFAHAGQVTQAVNAQARQAVGAWLNANPKQIFFGLNATSLMFHVARTLGQSWQAGDNIVLSALEHFSNVSSWQRSAEDKGVDIYTIGLTDNGCDINWQTLDGLINDKTRLVAITLASNVLGTKVDIAPIVKRAKQVGAVVAVDGVHAIVHDCLDVAALGVDVLFASAYKIGAGRLGICYMSQALLDTKPLYKVEPASNDTPNAWETGTQSFEAQASIVALLDYWANLANYHQDGQTDDLRTNLCRAYQVVKAYESTLSAAFLAHCNKRDYIQLYGKTTQDNRTPTFAFNLLKDGQILDPKSISQWFGRQNIALPCGNFYALDVARKLGLEQTGFLRAGFLHYNTIGEIDRLFDGLDEYVSTNPKLIK